MNSPNLYRTLLARTAVALAICVTLVVVCYFFVDKPVAFFVYRHGIAQTPTMKWFTEPPPLVPFPPRRPLIPSSESPPLH